MQGPLSVIERKLSNQQCLFSAKCQTTQFPSAGIYRATGGAFSLPVWQLCIKILLLKKQWWREWEPQSLLKNRWWPRETEWRESRFKQWHRFKTARQEEERSWGRKQGRQGEGALGVSRESVQERACPLPPSWHQCWLSAAWQRAGPGDQRCSEAAWDVQPSCGDCSAPWSFAILSKSTSETWKLISMIYHAKNVMRNHRPQ